MSGELSVALRREIWAGSTVVISMQVMGGVTRMYGLAQGEYTVRRGLMVYLGTPPIKGQETKKQLLDI